MESKEQNKKDKQVSIHHLYYAIAIACLISISPLQRKVLTH